MPISRAAFLRAVQTLGLSPHGDFDAADVQSQYRKVVQTLHPDRQPHLRDEAGANIANLSAARELLLQWIKEGKPGQQSDSDEQSRHQSSSRSPPPPGASSAAAQTISLKERIFSFYWKAGFLPNWRILFVPLGFAVLTGLTAPRQDAPPAAAVVQRPPPVSPPIKNTTPEITSTRLGWTVVTYQEVPYATFVPDLQALTDKYPMPLTVVMTKNTADVVSEILVQKVDRLYAQGRISSFPDKLREVMSNDMQSIVAQGAAILECRYATSSGGDHVKIFYYWYQFRPAEAEPAHARSIVANHPLLSLRAPRYNCPLRRRDAEDAL